MSKSRSKKLPSWATWKERASYLLAGVAIGSALGFGASSFEGDLSLPQVFPASPKPPIEIPEGVPVSGPLILKRKGYTVCYHGAPHGWHPQLLRSWHHKWKNRRDQQQNQDLKTTGIRLPG